MNTPAARSIFANRNFRLLFGGSTVSMLGDQFTLLALPWLVLQLTGNPAALGLVLATMALPRALFMLFGGAIVDRLSARPVLLLARLANAVLVALLAALVLGGMVRMPLVYLIALGIGLATAFAYPAGSALLPQLVAPAQLQASNALMMGMRQLSVFVGPALAGLVISAGALVQPDRARVQDAHGLGLAFAIDAASFAASLVSLLLLRVPPAASQPRRKSGVVGDVIEGVRAVWKDVPLRAFMLYAAVVTLFVGGPVQVGLPLLADTRLSEGAAALGVLMAANGGGMLVGGFLSHVLSRHIRGRLGLLVLGFDGIAGLGLAALALVHSTLPGAALMAALGVFSGIAQILVISWIQLRVPPALMGRTMSLLMFTFLGLGPLSAAVAGGVLKWIGLPVLFAGAGLTLTGIALACMASPALRAIGAAREDAAHGDLRPAPAAPDRSEA